jgi:hypothetical protein
MRTCSGLTHACGTAASAAEILTVLGLADAHACFADVSNCAWVAVTAGGAVHQGCVRAPAWCQCVGLSAPNSFIRQQTYCIVDILLQYDLLLPV